MEDTSSLSFAGLYDTFPGVSDADSCLVSIKKCWASLWTERVFRYMERHGLDYQALFMAVVVQRLIRADSSGVIFTVVGAAGPGRIVIEACRGQLIEGLSPALLFY